mgnify:CR=1 FL=1
MLSKGQQRYLEEYEKYKEVIVEPGLYFNKNRPIVEYEVLSVGVDEVTIKTVKSEHVTTKTLHWCRKNLTRINT